MASGPQGALVCANANANGSEPVHGDRVVHQQGRGV